RLDGAQDCGVLATDGVDTTVWPQRCPQRESPRVHRSHEGPGVVTPIISLGAGRSARADAPSNGGAPGLGPDRARDGITDDLHLRDRAAAVRRRIVNVTGLRIIVAAAFLGVAAEHIDATVRTGHAPKIRPRPRHVGAAVPAICARVVDVHIWDR